MEQTDGGSDDGVRLRDLHWVLARLPWLVPMACLALGLLVLAGLYGTQASGLFLAETRAGLGWLAAGVTLLAAVLIGLPLLLGGRAVRNLLLQLDRRQQAADVQVRRRARLADLTARLQPAQSPVELARLLLSELARAVPMQQALCCFWNEEGGTLKPVAHYGSESARLADAAQESTRLGGLLLEVARQRQPLALNRPGTGFLRIVSGLGDAEPAQLLLYPVQDRGRLFAVLELAGLQPFEAEDLDLLADLAPVFAMYLDILQRAEHSAVLLTQARAAEESMRRILGAVSEGIWGMDREGRTTFVNPAALALLGYQADEVLGQSMHALVHHHRPDGRELPVQDCPMYRTAQDGQERRIQGDVLWHKDGRAIAVDYVATPVWQDGAISGVVVVCREPAGAAASGDGQPAAIGRAA